MISKSKIKLIKSLKYKKTRDELNLFIVEGLKGILEVNKSNYDIHFTVISRKIYNQHKNFLPSNNIFILEENEINELSSLQNNLVGFCVVKTILKDLEGGKEFEILAKEHSIGPTGKNGGNLNWFDLSTMVPEFSTALMVLSEGDISQPVQTKFGWHLIKLNKTREKKIPEFEEIKAQLVQNLRQKKINDYLNSLSKNSEISFVGKNINPNEITNIKLLETLDE